MVSLVVSCCLLELLKEPSFTAERIMPRWGGAGEGEKDETEDSKMNAHNPDLNAFMATDTALCNTLPLFSLECDAVVARNTYRIVSYGTIPVHLSPGCF